MKEQGWGRIFFVTPLSVLPEPRRCPLSDDCVFGHMRASAFQYAALLARGLPQSGPGERGIAANDIPVDRPGPREEAAPMDIGGRSRWTSLQQEEGPTGLGEPVLAANYIPAGQSGFHDEVAELVVMWCRVDTDIGRTAIFTGKVQ